MGDWMMPFHMRSLKYFGDVVIPTNQSGGVTFTPTDLNPPSDFSNAVYKMEEGGTGFLISISEISINRVIKRIGLLLTAAHAVLDLCTGKTFSNTFECSLNGIEDTAYFVKEFTDDTNIKHRCLSTGSNYCLPGDVAILLIELNNSNPSSYLEPANQDRFVNGTPCYIAGFPVHSIDPRYCIPSSSISDCEVKSEIRKIFHDFNQVVFSKGSIVEQNNEILEISCSATSGMSGSPIIVNGKYVGVYVGGPPLPGQRKLIKSIHKVREDNFCGAMKILKSLEKYNKLYHSNVFRRFLDGRTRMVSIMAKRDSGKPVTGRNKRILTEYEMFPDTLSEEKKVFYNVCTDLLYELVWKFKKRDDYKANIGISYRNIVFRKVDAYVQRLSDASNIGFQNIEDLVNYLKSVS